MATVTESLWTKETDEDAGRVLSAGRVLVTGLDGSIVIWREFVTDDGRATANRIADQIIREHNGGAMLIDVCRGVAEAFEGSREPLERDLCIRAVEALAVADVAEKYRRRISPERPADMVGAMIGVLRDFKASEAVVVRGEVTAEDNRRFASAWLRMVDLLKHLDGEQ
jgi:hypothetical protein